MKVQKETKINLTVEELKSILIEKFDLPPVGTEMTFDKKNRTVEIDFRDGYTVQDVVGITLTHKENNGGTKASL